MTNDGDMAEAGDSLFLSLVRQQVGNRDGAEAGDWLFLRPVLGRQSGDVGVADTLE